MSWYEDCFSITEEIVFSAVAISSEFGDPSSLKYIQLMSSKFSWLEDFLNL